MSEKRLQEAIEYNDKKTDEMIDEIVFTRWIDPTIEEKDKEIERLNKEIEIQVQFSKVLMNNNIKLHSIIKEVREMAEEKSSEELGGWSWKVLEIIDKENI